MTARGEVGRGDFKPGAVERYAIAADAVDGSLLADDAVDSDQVADGAIDYVHLASACVTSILAAAYPVGSIYISTNGTNPATSLGFGTWAAFGAGRVPVGLDSGDTDFDTDEETGGAKTHTLTTAELPANNVSVEWTGTTSTGGGATRVVDIADLTSSTGASSGQVNATGGSGDPHNNMPPYVVVRMWKRTA